jgi:RHS repeat-associated protein
MFDRTNGGAPSQTLGYAQRLNGSTNEKYGLARSLSVMPGDVINAEVYAKYVDPVTSNWNTALATLMSNIASSAAGVVIDGANYTTSTSSFPASYPGLVTKTDNGAPKAYLNWLVFDRNYAFINGGFQQISTACRETGTDVAHERLASPTITITQPGYVYIYVSNDNPTQTEVFFDDLSVSQTKSPIVSTDDYMPFGLTFNSFQRESSFANRWKFQEQERITEMGLNWDSFKWRNHQPDIGRFFNIDPLAEKYYYNSPYAFSENKVTGHRELEGLEAESIIKNEIKKVENVYNDAVHSVKTTTTNVVNSVVNYVKGLFAKNNDDIKNVVGVNEKQTDPQATDKLWLGGTDPQFQLGAKAKQVENNDGIVMQTEGAMREVEGTGSDAKDVKVQDVNNVGQKDQYDTIITNGSFHVESGTTADGKYYYGVVSYPTETIIRNGTDTIVKNRMYVPEKKDKKSLLSD